MGRLPALMTTAEVAEVLGVTPTTVAHYARLGLLPVLVKTRPMLFAGDDVSGFKRSVFPLIRRGRGHKYPKVRRRQ